MRAWRELTDHTTRGPLAPDARTLLACSGGADSSALVLALAPLSPRIVVVAHIVHDLRPRAQALADRDAVAALAARLGLEFVESHIAVRAQPGNAEAAARRLRYDALAKLARAHGCRFVATAHHADDQLETMLMGLLRGSGPAGLAGAAPRRPLARGIELIRPMLHVTRRDAEGLCRASDWSWQTDATNADTSRLRANLRARVVPLLREIRPDAGQRASHAADLLRAAAGLIRARAASLLDRADPSPDPASAASNPAPIRWSRPLLRDEPLIVVGELLRLAIARLTGGSSMDRLGQVALTRAARAIRDRVGGEREFRLSRARLWVTRDRVVIERAEE